MGEGGEMKAYDWSNKNLRVVEWVKCSERMPEIGKNILFGYLHSNLSIVCQLTEEKGKYFWLHVGGNGKSTKIQTAGFHWWMELPELPEQKEKSIFDRIELPTEIKESDRFSHSVKIEAKE